MMKELLLFTIRCAVALTILIGLGVLGSEGFADWMISCF